jgi:hypothetical protein
MVQSVSLIIAMKILNAPNQLQIVNGWIIMVLLSKEKNQALESAFQTNGPIYQVTYLVEQRIYITTLISHTPFL